MLTPFGEKIDPAAPRGEYPRPQLVRDSFLSLNGSWSFTGAPKAATPQRFGGEITVPFPPESRLSGVGRPAPKGYALWYKRSFSLPEGFIRGRVLLHIDAADQNAVLWCNGEKLAEHSGGYTPFIADITDVLQEENELLIRVEDNTDAGLCSYGAQKRHSPWSGLWQSVWCESVPEKYIDSLHIVPRLQEGCVELTVFPGGSAEDGDTCTALIGDTLYELTCGTAYSFPVPDAPLWTPETPTLCPLVVTLGEDRVESYYAMREFTAGQTPEGQPCFLLNGEPCFVSGVLLQGYWPDGLSSAPSDEALEADIRAAKVLGFNTLRLRDKIECPRFYYHCDRLGLMVWQGMPTGGKDTAPKLPIPDDRYNFYGRKDPGCRSQFMRELRESIHLLRNCPSVVLWEIFDESRGRFDAENLFRYVQELDSSRPIDPVSGHDVPFGSVRTLHSSARRPSFAPDKNGRVLAISDFGALGQEADGHTLPGKARANTMFDSPQGLLFALEELYEDFVRPAAAEGLAGCIYCQLTDVENEVSGLVSYDRRIFKLAPRQLRGLFSVKF